MDYPLVVLLVGAWLGTTLALGVVAGRLLRHRRRTTTRRWPTPERDRQQDSGRR